MNLVLKITAGILLAAFILFLAKNAYWNYQAYELARSIEQMEKDARQKAAAKRQAIHDQKVQEARRAIIAKDTQRQKSREAAVREAAWKAFYQQPEDCLSYKSNKHMVECGNKRVRARREFDQQWALKE